MYLHSYYIIFLTKKLLMHNVYNKTITFTWFLLLFFNILVHKHRLYLLTVVLYIARLIQTISTSTEQLNEINASSTYIYHYGNFYNKPCVFICKLFTERSSWMGTMHYFLKRFFFQTRIRVSERIWMCKWLAVVLMRIF